MAEQIDTCRTARSSSNVPPTHLSVSKGTDSAGVDLKFAGAGLDVERLLAAICQPATYLGTIDTLLQQPRQISLYWPVQDLPMIVPFFPGSSAAQTVATPCGAGVRRVGIFMRLDASQALGYLSSTGVCTMQVDQGLTCRSGHTDLRLSRSSSSSRTPVRASPLISCLSEPPMWNHHLTEHSDPDATHCQSSSSSSSPLDVEPCATAYVLLTTSPSCFTYRSNWTLCQTDLNGRV